MRSIRLTSSLSFLRSTSRLNAHVPIFLGLVGLLAACSETPVSPAGNHVERLHPTSEIWSGTPVYEAGNPTCNELGFLSGVKGENLTIGTPVTVGPVTYTLANDSTIASWTSSVPVDGVFMKAANGGLLFTYVGGATTGGGEYTPTNTQNGKKYKLSHVLFCYYGRFSATIEGAGLYTRDYDWGIAKAASAPTSIAKGSSLLVDYTVTMSRSYTDRNFLIEGSVIVFNIGYGATGVVLGVDADIGGYPAVISCPGITFPKTMADGESFACDYSLSVPDGSPLLETWTVTVDESSGWRSTTFTDPVVFGDPTSFVDDVVTLFDTRVPGGLGMLTAPGSVQYSVTYGPYSACVPIQLDNVASYLTDDTGETGADTASVIVDVTGCSADVETIGTAFAFSGDPGTSFSALGIATRWGWTINFGGPGTKTYDVYVGAGRNILSNGTKVGTVTITYTGSNVTVTYNLLPNYSIEEQHLYAGASPAPMRANGKKAPVPTVAPGQYAVNVSGGSIWVIAHSVIGYAQP